MKHYIGKSTGYHIDLKILWNPVCLQGFLINMKKYISQEYIKNKKQKGEGACTTPTIFLTTKT